MIAPPTGMLFLPITGIHIFDSFDWQYGCHAAADNLNKYTVYGALALRSRKSHVPSINAP